MFFRQLLFLSYLRFVGGNRTLRQCHPRRIQATGLALLFSVLESYAGVL